jgi:hypothetical protein
MIGVPYRMNLISLFVIPLLFFYRNKWGNVVFAYLGLIIISFLSMLINQTPVTAMLIFLRTVLFSLLIYALVKLYVNNNKNSISVFRWCLRISVIQLPVVLFEQFIYKFLPNSIISQVSFIDFDFGTFNFKGDSTLAFFLLCEIIFLLFDVRRKLVVKEKFRYLILVWLTFTVLVVNSSMARLIVIIIWLIFFFKNTRPAYIFRVGLIVSMIVAMLFLAGIPKQINDDLRSLIENKLSTDSRTRSLYFSERYSPVIAFTMDRVSIMWLSINSIISGNEEKYLSGRYSRGGALSYFSSQGLSLIGDGPGIYYDPMERVMYRGRVGHFFTLYSEVGLTGLLLSYLVFFLVVSENGLRFKSWMWLYIGAIFGMSFTVDVLNNICIFLTFCIFVLGSRYLSSIPPSKKLSWEIQGEKQ